MIVEWNGNQVPEEEVVFPVVQAPTVYADGLYETLRVYQGSLSRGEQHLERLFHSCREVEMPFPLADGTDLERRVSSLLQANGMSGVDARVRITLHRGGTGREESHCVIVVFRLDDRVLEEKRQKGVRAIIASQPRNPVDPAYRVKSLGLFYTAQALREARAAGVEEALFVNTRGELCESTYANLFLVRDRQLLTPPLESPCLPGLTRAEVLMLAAEMGLLPLEVPLQVLDLEMAEEVFLASTVSELIPVVGIVGTPVRVHTPGPWTSRLQAAYRQRVTR